MVNYLLKRLVTRRDLLPVNAACLKDLYKTTKMLFSDTLTMLEEWRI